MYLILLFLRSIRVLWKVTVVTVHGSAQGVVTAAVSIALNTDFHPVLLQEFLFQRLLIR